MSPPSVSVVAPTIIFLLYVAGLPGEGWGGPAVLQGAATSGGVGQCGHRPGAHQLDEGAVGAGPSEYQHLLRFLFWCTGYAHTAVVTHFTHWAPCLCSLFRYCPRWRWSQWRGRRRPLGALRSSRTLPKLPPLLLWVALMFDLFYVPWAQYSACTNLHRQVPHKELDWQFSFTLQQPRPGPTLGGQQGQDQEQVPDPDQGQPPVVEPMEEAEVVDLQPQPPATQGAVSRPTLLCCFGKF